MTGQNGNPSLMTLRIIWGAMLTSLAMYVVVLQVTAAGREASLTTPTLTALSLAAITAAVTSVVLPRFLFRAAASATQIETEQIADPNGSAIFRDAAPTLTVFANEDDARRRALAVFQTPFILSLALSEAVGVLGFVLGFLGGDVPAYAPLMILSAMLVALRFPTEARVYGGFAAAKNAHFRPSA